MPRLCCLALFAWAFTGHERDGRSLDYMHARYYDPLLGRFPCIGPGPATTGAAILGHEVHEQYGMQTKGAGYPAAHAAGILKENAIAGSTRLDANASPSRSGSTITFKVRYRQNGGIIPFRIHASLANGLITGVEPRP